DRRDPLIDLNIPVSPYPRYLRPQRTSASSAVTCEIGPGGRSAAGAGGDDLRYPPVAVLREPRDGARMVDPRAVLAHLPFALEPGNRQLDADDAPQHARDEVGRRVAHRPRRGAAGLVGARQLSDQRAQPLGIVDELRGAVGMDCDVVPGRHDLAGL